MTQPLLALGGIITLITQRPRGLTSPRGRRPVSGSSDYFVRRALDASTFKSHRDDGVGATILVTAPCKFMQLWRLFRTF
jgi:hypothetical protein